MKARRSLAGRLVDRLPPENRVWGQALIAESDYLAGRKRFAWLCGLLALCLVGAGRRRQRPSASRRGLRFGLALGAFLAIGIVAGNVGPLRGRPTSDSAVASAAGFLAIAGALLLIGFLNRRQLAGTRACAAATAITGLVAFLISIATFAVIDNVFLSTVAQQPDKIWGLAHSHYHTMREYINADLARSTAFMIPVTIFGAAALGAAGAALGRARHPRPDP